MYDIKQFRPALYALVLLGIFGFALASESLAALVLGGGMTLLNAWLVKTDRFKPMPRWAANVLTLGVAAFILSRLSAATPILLICEFLLALQIIKLFEQRANRDYAQLIVLSLLLMVASIINTASLVFAIIFVAYMFLALYCCLLFHLKIETEHARQLMGLNKGVAARLASPLTLRQDQRMLPASMRKLTVLVSVYAVSIGVLVFLFFPRGAGAGMLGLQFKPPVAQTGYSPDADFQRAASLGQDNTVVGHASVTINDKPQLAGELYLRGSTLDIYESNPEAANRWQWSRGGNTMGGEELRVRVGDQVEFERSSHPDVQNIVQEIMLQPMPDPTLFAIAGVYSISAQRDLIIVRTAADQTARLGQPLLQPLKYTARSTGISTRNLGDLVRNYPRSIVPESIANLAKDPAVSGFDTDGVTPLVTKVSRNRVTEVNRRVARNIENYLRSNFKYSLDVTKVRKVDDDADPMVGFLFDFKQGHCQYFASAMVLMCQSLDIPTRYVSGFRTSEFNNTPGAGYFIIRQSHAHAWVEVLLPDGWETFDPTSGDEVDAAIGQKSGLFTNLKHFLDLLQFTWANNVVAYDQGSRNSLIEQLGTNMDQAAVRSSGRLSDWLYGTKKDGKPEDGFLQSLVLYSITSWAIGGLLFLMGLGALIAVAIFVVQRVKLNRRAKRIGLVGLDADLQRQLARQLGFYDTLLSLLEERGCVRPVHLTPREFALQLSQLPAAPYRSINRLTEIYYRVRYGQQQLSPVQQRRLEKVVEQIQSAV